MVQRPRCGLVTMRDAHGSQFRGLPEMQVAIRTSGLACRKIGKARVFTPDLYCIAISLSSKAAWVTRSLRIRGMRPNAGVDHMQSVLRLVSIPVLLVAIGIPQPFAQSSSRQMIAKDRMGQYAVLKNMIDPRQSGKVPHGRELQNLGTCGDMELSSGSPTILTRRLSPWFAS